MIAACQRIWICATVLCCGIAGTAQFTFDMPGATATYVTGINDADDFVGYYTLPNGDTDAFYVVDGEVLSFTVDGLDTWFGGINNSGQIVGRYNPSGASTDYHAFVFTIADASYSVIDALEGFEWTSPNDINDSGQVSGDLKNGANRRVFIWDESAGLTVESYFLNGSPAPTYGGHSIDASGRVTGWYIDGAVYTSFRWHPDLGYTDIVDLPDPEFPASHKTRLMGTNNNGRGVLDFITSDDCHLFDFNATEAWGGLEKLVPNSTEIHGHDINDSGHLCGWYTDQDYAVHGFVDVAIQTDFDVNTHGHAFDNTNDPVWNWDFEAYAQMYQYDPYYWGYGYPFPQPSPGYLFFASSYPGWADFVRVMGTQSCYFNVNFQGVAFDTPVLRPHAFNAWKIHKTDDFEGACFGMASNAGAAWQFPELLNQKFNPSYTGIPDMSDVYALGNNSYVISAANQGMAAQASQTYTGINAGWDTVLPHEIMSQLFETFLYDTEVPVIGFNLQLSVGLFGHAVFPYAMIPRPGELNTYDLVVYDPNASGNGTVAFEIVYFEDLSSYSIAFGDETTPPEAYGMQLMFAQDLYAPTLVPGFMATEVRSEEQQQVTSTTARASAEDCVRLFSLNASEVTITGAGGALTAAGNDISNTIDGARPRFRFTGQPETVNQFELPLGTYVLENTLATDGGFDAGLVIGGTVINYHRDTASGGQSDQLALDGASLEYINTSGSASAVRAEVMAYVGGAEWNFDITGLELEEGQGVSLEMLEDGLFISNEGLSTDYDVAVTILDPEAGVLKTEVSGIPLGAGITQIIIPDFGEDGLDGVTVQDGSTGTETDYSNEGIPQLIASTDTLWLTNAAQVAEIAVANFGAGSMAWGVSDQPDWITLTGANAGTNSNVVELSVEENPEIERSGWIAIESEDETQELGILIIQNDNATAVDSGSQDALRLYPNPVRSELTVALPSVFHGRQMKWELHAMNGDRIAEGADTGQSFTLDVSGYAPGIYVLHIHSGNVSLAKRFVRIAE